MPSQITTEMVSQTSPLLDPQLTNVVLSSPSTDTADQASPLTPPVKVEQTNYDFMPDDMFTENAW